MKEAGVWSLNRVVLKSSFGCSSYIISQSSFLLLEKGYTMTLNESLALFGKT